MTLDEQLKRGESAERRVQEMLANERSLLLEIEQLRRDLEIWRRNGGEVFMRAKIEWLKAENKRLQGEVEALNKAIVKLDCQHASEIWWLRALVLDGGPTR